MSIPFEFTTELPCDAISIRAIQSRIAGVLNDLGFPASDKIEVRLAVAAAIDEAVGIDEVRKSDRGLMLNCSANPDVVRIEIKIAGNGAVGSHASSSDSNTKTNRKSTNGDTFVRALMSVVSYDPRSGQVILKKNRHLNHSKR